jgi:hypothetical protein
MWDEGRQSIEWACTRVINLYALLNDAADWEGVAGLYTPDGRMARPSAPNNPVVGRDAILASLKSRPPRAARHVISNIVVDVDSDTEARAMSVILLFQGEAGEDGSLPTRDQTGPLVGYFKDRLVLTEEGWRFAERVGGLDFAP